MNWPPTVRSPDDPGLGAIVRAVVLRSRVEIARRDTWSDRGGPPADAKTATILLRDAMTAHACPLAPPGAIAISPPVRVVCLRGPDAAAHLFAAETE